MEAVSITRHHREGAVGALMDEYDRAVAELKCLVSQISVEDFEKVVDPITKDEECRSVETIMSHVVGAGYGYADYLRKAFGMASSSPKRELIPGRPSFQKLDEMLTYTAETLEGKWEMTYDEISSVSMLVRWGPTYDVEQLLEHAIVHVMRHRRQIEKFIQQGLIASTSSTQPDISRG